ncbi:hypothetical protein PHET_04892 [Paragonimus heterotremus]|uniref:Uncharacterized protein n=1 Tax=Paragonimus heterotremus TaxID=100268 RepID=A0A8J4SQ47_9TREM|nr:hypothetical protein PHET_04892 [Paragonimus heterotremus]
MVGIEMVEDCESDQDSHPKYKRRSFLARMGQRISRAFHRKAHANTSKGIKNKKLSHSTGDLIKDTQSPTKPSKKYPNNSHDAGTSLSAEDRAASVGHIQGACASSSRSSESDYLPSAFRPSAFRDELNSKLRLRPACTSHDRPIAGAKSAGSSGSLISEDSPLCTPKSYTSLPPSGKRASTVPTTPASNSVGSSAQSVSPSMTGLQHKLAVSRQRNRRPPSKLTPNVTPNSYSVQDESTGGLDAGCADFFTSPWTIQSEGQSSFTSSFHLDFITEEENEPLAAAQVPANTTPPVSHSKSILKRATRCDPVNPLDNPEDCAISKRRSHPTTESDSENAKLARPDSSSSNSFNSSSLERRVTVLESPVSLSDEPRPAPRYKHLVPNDSGTEETLLEPGRRLARPRSMFVSTPLCHPAVKMHAPSSGASPPITLRKVPVVEDAPSSSPEVEHAQIEPPCSTHDTDEDSPCLRSVADRASIFGATLHTPKPVARTSDSEPMLRHSPIDQTPTTKQNRASRVFDLVKNFEQTC